jgi:hypothetical protein
MHESTDIAVSYDSFTSAKIPLLEQTVILLRRRPDVRCYQNSNDERVDRNDTGHDDGDE